MNLYDLNNELSTTSESDSEYLVDSRYCRTTLKCKRKALKKTIKLIHGRCVVIYRGSGDLLSIAAKDAERNSYCDFVFVCHDPKPNKIAREPSIISRSKSAMHDSSASDDKDHENNNHHIFHKRFIPSNNNQHSSEQTSFSFKTKIIDGNHNESTIASLTSEKESSIKNNATNKDYNKIEKQRLNEQIILEEVDVDVDDLVHADELTPSIVYFSSAHTKTLSNVIPNSSE